MLQLRNRRVLRVPARNPAPRINVPAAEARGARGAARANAPGGDAAEAVNLPAAHRMNFKDIKTATEALLTTMPRFSGEKDEDPYIQWIEKFVRESNALRLGRQLTIAVFPRMLSASARLKYDGLSNEEKADFGLATQALAEKLRVSSGRDKALNELSKTTKKTTESMVRFAKRIENVTRTAFPGLENEQRTEITINRFIQGLPSRIKVKMLEKDTPEDLEDAISLAEKMEEIIKEEDEETINLIDRVKISDRNNEEESLREQIRELTIESKRQRRMIEQIGNSNPRGLNTPRNQGFSRGRANHFNHQDRNQGQRNPHQFGYPPQRGSSNFGRYSGNRGNSYSRGEWNANRAPMQSGVHFLMIVACLTIFLPVVSSQFQICPNVRSGEYFAPPPQMSCELNPVETVVKAAVDIYTEFGASMKAKAYRCSKTTYSVCSPKGWLEWFVRKPNIVNITTTPMTKSECEEAMNHHQVRNQTLISKGNGIFHSLPSLTKVEPWIKERNCDEGTVFSLEVGEIATPDGVKVISSLGDMAGCQAHEGQCELTDALILWISDGITKFCKFSKIQTTEAYITKTKVVIPSLQMAMEISQNQTDSQIENCSLRMTVITNNGFMISIKNHRQSLTELINSVEKNQRMRRSLTLKEKPKGPLIERLFGPEATIDKYPLFSHDPITDPRIIHEMRRNDITMSQVKWQWENYRLPNMQMAVLRAIREGEYRKQLIRELRENPGNLENAVTIKQLEQPSHHFDGYLNDEFGIAHPIISKEGNHEKEVTVTKKEMPPTTTKTPLNREMAGVEYIKQISELHRKASENRENSQLNGRLQFVADKIIETNYQEFDKIYHRICEMQNSHIEISKTLLAIDPTLGMRTLLKRNDIVAKRAGMVYLVSQCSEVIAEKVFYDHKVNGTCYIDTPVQVQNQTWFIAPGMEKDLMKDSVEIPCDQVTLGIYKDAEGNWKSQNGLSVVRNIPVTFIEKTEKLNLTLSAPPVFSKMENIDNPFAYLATWTNKMINMKITQIELMQNLRNEGLSSETVEDMLIKAANSVKTIAEEIENSIDIGTDFVRNEVLGFLKKVIMPIVLIAIVAVAIVIAFKIYFVRKAAGIAMSELVKITRKAPPTIQRMIRRWQPEVNNIMLRDDEPTEMNVFNIERSDSIITMPEIYWIATEVNETENKTIPVLKVKVNKVVTRAVLDTGANISLISESMVKRMRKEESIEKSPVRARTANGTTLNLYGKITETVKIRNHKISLSFFVVKSHEITEDCVLGIDAITQFNKKNLEFAIGNGFIKIGNTKIPFEKNSELLMTVESKNDQNWEDDNEAGWTDELLKTVQNSSPRIEKMLKLFWKGQATQQMKEKYCIINNTVHIIPKRKQEVPPVLLDSCEMARALVQDIHGGLGHKNIRVTKKEVGKIAVWKGMKKDIQKVINSCKTCRTKRNEKIQLPVGSIMTVGGRAHLPFVPIHLDGTPIVALLDSGASVSLIPESVVKQLKIEDNVTVTHCSAKVANGTKLQFLGEVSIIVTMGKTSVSHKVLITKDEGAPAACLLGIDFISAINKQGQLLTFDMAKKIVRVGKEEVKLLDPNQIGHKKLNTITVTCANDEVIPARCQAIISGKMPGVIMQNSEFIINDTDRETEDIYSISPTLTKMDNEGNVVMRITNPGNSDLVLRKGTRIAEAEVWKGTDTSPQEMTPEQYANENIESLLKKIKLENSALSGRSKTKVRLLVQRYHLAFVGLDGKIGQFKGITTHHIELNDNHRIPQSRPYRINPQQKTKLEKQVKQMKANGLIEESTSPYTSPLLMIPKPNGEIRIVIDYRRLNLITRSRTYIMPNTIDICEEASRGKLFSVFDIAQGFHTIPMHEAHKERTAFCCHMGVFQYRKMPMGLKGAPDTFQRAMAEVERQFSGTLILYVDDLIVVSNDEDQHITHLEEFFQLMIKMGLKLKAEKSQIGRTKISFLGFTIENNTITPNGEKTEAIQKFPTPQTLSDVKSFMGMAGYFRRFIKDFGIIGRPLTMLTQKNVLFKWGKEQEEAFQEIKKKLMSPPILTTPKMDGDFELHTDASKIGIAAVLLQNQEGELKVIGYASRPTTSVENKYAPIELEALAITWGLTHFRPYVFGRKVKVVTDHQPLKSLLHRKEKEMSGRLLRHQAIIQMYDVEIAYRPGKENPLADALSRQKIESEQVAFIKEDNEHQEINLEKMQQNSELIQNIKRKMKYGNNEEARKLKCKYFLINDFVYGFPVEDDKLPPILIEGRNKESKRLIRHIHKTNNHIGALNSTTLELQLLEMVIAVSCVCV
ncbi:hypothetical protein CRE_10709 [Caenorhabditis remanei]|uniref:RNA-directed DNA polymerase n=1 Tax=Caenorhabditis remanei TaxID=31234 RepID=E3NLW9_CAERE|nr:hypothetical protein CRE_10709 [Caenorhabditis remanei]